MIGHRSPRPQVASVGPDLADALVGAQATLEGFSQVGVAIQAAVDTLTLASPEPLKPLISTLGGDVASIAQLSPTAPGLARLVVRS